MKSLVLTKGEWPVRFRGQAEVGLLLAITGVALALRIVNLGDIPPGLHGDEAWTGLEAQRILRDGPIGPWSHSALGQPAGSFYWTAFNFLFLDPGIFSVRFSIALLGAFTVPAFYLFARALVGRSAAALGAALLAVSFWHLHYSRVAFPVATLPLVECVALYLLVRGIREGRIALLAAAGGTSALGVYLYMGFLSFALALILVWAFLVLGRRCPTGWLLKGVAAFLLVAVVVAVPFLYTLARSPSDVLSYGGVSSPFNELDYREGSLGEKALFVLKRLVRGFAVYGVGRQVDFTDGLGARGLLDPLTLGLFALGALVAVRRWREWRMFLLLAGLIAGVLATAYLSLPTWGENRRGISALPMVFVLAGLGGHGLVILAGHWVDRRWPYLVLGLALLLAAFLNLRYYFGPLADAPETRWVFAQEIARASKYVGTLPGDDLYVYFYSGRWSYNYETRRFLLPDVPGEDRSREFGRYSLDWRPEHRRALFLLLGPYDTVLNDLVERYPTGTYQEEREDGRFIFGAYLVKEVPMTLETTPAEIRPGARRSLDSD